MAKHTQTICRQIADNCFSVFGHFVRLALKGLKQKYFWRRSTNLSFSKISLTTERRLTSSLLTPPHHFYTFNGFTFLENTICNLPRVRRTRFLGCDRFLYSINIYQLGGFKNPFVTIISLFEAVLWNRRFLLLIYMKEYISMNNDSSTTQLIFTCSNEPSLTWSPKRSQSSTKMINNYHLRLSP